MAAEAQNQKCILGEILVMAVTAKSDAIRHKSGHQPHL